MSNLAKRLQMKPGTAWLLINTPPAYPALLDIPDDVELHTAANRAFTGIQLFAKNSSELASALNEVKPVLKPETIFWIMYPKKNSGIPTDLLMTRNWELMDAMGWRPVQSAAVDEVWTALRFKPENLVKASNINNAALKTNEYAEFIDPENRRVTLPPQLHAHLAQQPAAMAAFEKLAYSHKKEYVLWILTAKQEQTRITRTEKMLQMLLGGKKNPSDK